MAPDVKCALCGGDLDNPSRASVCSRCLLQDAGNLQPDDTCIDADSWVNADDKGPTVSHAAIEALGRYTQAREHARGGMGRILLVRDEQLGRDVILKELLGEARNGAAEARPPGRLRESTPVAARFVREARIAGQLEHPSIIPVHELGFRENGDLYYTMKYVQGVSLSESLDKAAGLDERLRLLPHILNVCQAIAYAHSRGVIHRDIKPANIMVGEFGETVIIDWGLARVKGVHEEANGGARPSNGAIDMGGGGDSGKTTYGQVLGTPAYMAPEQAQGHTDAVDEHSDVYALGALVYTLLTGKPPFSGDNRDDIIRRAATGAPEPVGALEPKAPAELVAICTKAMAKEPAQRYPSAKALAEELQRFLTGGLVSAHEYRVYEHLHRFVRRNKKAVATAAVAFVIINVVTIGSYARIFGERNSAIEARNDAIHARDEATQARDDATQSGEQAEQEAYFRAISYAHARIQQGEYGEVPKLLEELPERFRGWEWGYLMGQCRLEDRCVQAHQGPITAFAASRDGSVLATAGEDGNLILWDGHTLTERWRWPHKTGISALALDPENKILVASSEGLLVLDCTTGDVIMNSIPRRYDSNRMQEFAMSMRVTGAPEGGGDGCVRFYPTSRELGQVPFQFHNGDQIIRLNLRDAQDPSLAVYDGPIVYYRLTLPVPDRPQELNAFLDTKVEIDWIAITDDPAFTPDKNPQGNSPNEPSTSDLEERAVWTFDKDNEGWAPHPSQAALTVATHADGKLVLTFGPAPVGNPSVRFWPSQEGDPVNAIAFSLDGTRLYVLGDRRPAIGKQIRVLNTADWKEEAVIRNAITGKMPDLRAAAMALSPDGTQVVAAATVDGPEGRANYYWGFDTSSYEPLWQFHESSTDTHLSVKVVDVSFDPTSRYLLCIGEGWMGLRNLSDGKLERQWRAYVDLHTSQASKSVWRDQTHFLVGDRQGAVTLYSTENEETETVVSNGSNISSLAMYSDDGRITTADRDGVLKSWLPEAASQMRGAVDLRTTDFDWGMSPRFSPDGKLLVVWGFDAGLTAWDTDTVERVPFRFPAGESFLGFRPGTDEAALRVDGGRAIRFRRLGDGAVTHEVPLNPELEWNSFTMDGAGKYAAFATNNRFRPSDRLQLVEISTGRALPAEWPAVLSMVRLSADGRRLAVGRWREGRVDIWSVPECRLYRTLSGSVEGPAEERGIHSMAFHPSQEMIAAATGTGRLLLWNYKSGELLLAIQAHEYGETSVCFSPDGERLATGGDDGYVRLWDWRTSKQLLAFQDNHMVRGVAFSPDGNVLASGGADPPVRVRIAWPRSGDLLPELQQRITCHARLLILDDAKFAWAEANHRQPEDAVVSVSDLSPYFADRNALTICPSGGTYQLGTVQSLPSCSEHGALDDNPTLMARFDELQDAEELAFKVNLARLRTSPHEIGSLIRRLSTLSDENDPVFQAILSQLCDSPQTTAEDLTNLAWQWLATEARFHRSAIRAVQRAVERDPGNLRSWRTLAYGELRAGQVDDAIAHFREGLENDSVPSSVGLALALVARGNAADLTEACDLLETHPIWEGTAYTTEILGKLQTVATEDTALQARIQAQLAKHENHVKAGEFNSTAWSPPPGNPEQVLELATEAVALTERKDGNILDKLAKALAESGRFEEAVQTQKEALSVLGISADDQYNGYVQRLREYESALAKTREPQPGPASPEEQSIAPDFGELLEAPKRNVSFRPRLNGDTHLLESTVFWFYSLPSSRSLSLHNSIPRFTHSCVRFLNLV